MPNAKGNEGLIDEGFLRMSRGGEAFGRRPPPPPLILNPPHLSTQPPRHFQTPSPHLKDKVKSPSSPSSSRPDPNLSGDKTLNILNNNQLNRTLVNSGGSGVLPSGQGSSAEEDHGREGGLSGGGPLTASNPGGQLGSGGKPLEKDVNAVFSKVSPGGTNNGAGDSGTDSDAHPLLGITPAAPGEAFDFNPILSNPAVTRILAGSSGRMPQWEPTMSDFHESSHGPEVNYTADTAHSRGYGSSSNSFNPTTQQQGSSSNGGTAGNSMAAAAAGTSGNGQVVQRHNPKNPVFVPSPVSSKGSSTMYNMDQMTNNIAIPKHTLPNPSNLATSRTTITEDNGDFYGEAGHGGVVEDRDNHHDRFSPNPGNSGSSNHLDESRGDGANPYVYDEDDSGVNEGSGRNYLGSSNPGDAQGKRGIWKGESGPNGQDNSDSRHENGGLKYIVCDALCGAWKHQCKLMGILFSITSVLCLLFAFAVLYSLQFQLRDFAPFSVILLFLFATSASRAFILLSESFCSPVSRPTWLPIVSTLPPAFFTISILVALRLARFPFPFIKSYTISCYSILVISLVALLPPLGLSLGAHFHPPSHAILSQVAWITSHVVVALVSLAYLFKFRPFYNRLSNERGTANMSNGAPTSCIAGLNGSSNGNFGISPDSNHLSTALKKRGFIVNWGCLQARAMFGVALFVLSLSTMIIISVAMSRGECESSSTWTGWVLSLCARMLEFAIVILLLLVTISSADVRFLSRLTRVPINKSNVGLINADIFPTMVSSNTAVQRCIPMYSSNTRADVMMLGPTESRSSLRGKTFGERALPGERLGEYRSSVGRGLPLRLGNGPSQSLPGTPLDGFPQGLRLPEPAPASLLVTKVVFGTPAVSREVNLNHQHENPLLCTGEPDSSKEDRETNNIYASLESVKIASMVNAGSSTGSNHSGSDRVLLSAPRDYIYSISRDLTKTIDSIYDTSRPRSNNLAHTIEALCPPLAHTIEQIGSIPNLNGSHNNRSGQMNFHTHSFHHQNNGGSGNMTGLTPARTDLARTIDRIRYAASSIPPNALTTPTNNSHPGRNFVLQLGTPGTTHLPGMGNPPPYCSSESSHDVTPDSGIVSDIHSKSGRMDIPEVVYAREYRRNSVEDVRRLPLIPVPKQHRSNTPGSTPLYDRTPTSPTNPSSASSPTMHTGNSPQFIPTPSPNNSIVGRVEHLLNQTEHILSRTESLDSNSNSAGLQRLLSHKEQLEHVERLLAQAEYAIWLEKRNCAQQVSQLSPAESPCSYVYSPGPTENAILPSSAAAQNVNAASSFPQHNSANSANPVQSLCKENCTSNSSSMVVKTHCNSNSANNSTSSSSTSNNLSTSNNHNGGVNSSHYAKKISKNLEEESVV
ncbi:unnamed protein product [Allacma fusca]|uniref:Uncharacterized protein n=1 Tax=Allacma fusca TaxID=39272 RepID=A0A8J2LAJ3_9HEXA|nr:unnamed protein product [Allacma fusca]